MKNLSQVTENLDIVTKEYLDNHIPSDVVTLSGTQTITGIKTFNAPANVSGTETTTAKFKTSNGGSVTIGKEGPNSGTMLRLDQVDGTARLRFRASATAGAMVWSQAEAGAALYMDLANSSGTNARLTFNANGIYAPTLYEGSTALSNKYYLASNPNGYTSNTGTVTSVGMTVPTGFSVSGTPITGSGTFALSFASGYTGYTTAEKTKLSGIATGATANTGTVTSVGISTSTDLSVSSSPITTSGDISVNLPTRIRQNSSSGYSNANDATIQGWHYLTSNSTNAPTFKQVDGATSTDYRIMTTAYSDNWLQQIATDFRSNDIFTRRCQQGTWQAWTPLVKMQQGADPCGYTDNSIPRWDTGRNATLQSSGVTINDSDNIYTSGEMTAASYNITSYAHITYDSTNECINFTF